MRVTIPGVAWRRVEEGDFRTVDPERWQRINAGRTMSKRGTGYRVTIEAEEPDIRALGDHIAVCYGTTNAIEGKWTSDYAELKATKMAALSIAALTGQDFASYGIRE